jgi:hypothetical protein
MSAPMPRSCWATGTACSPPPRRPARPSKARRSPAASAPRPAPSSACASIRETLEPRFKVIGVDLWSDEPGFDEATVPASASPASAARHHRGRGRNVSSPASSRRTASSTARWRRARPRIQAERPHLLLPAARRRSAADHGHPERRARHPARQGRALCRRQAADGQARRRQGRPITLAGAFGSHHRRRNTRWCWA